MQRSAAVRDASKAAGIYALARDGAPAMELLVVREALALNEELREALPDIDSVTVDEGVRVAAVEGAIVVFQSCGVVVLIGAPECVRVSCTTYGVIMRPPLATLLAMSAI